MLINCGDLLHLTLCLHVMGIIVPYMISLHRNIFEPPLPFISQAVGSMPESGLFSLFIIPGSFMGIFSCALINKVSTAQVQRFLEIIDKASVWCGVLYFLSWVFISAFPFTFTDLPNKHEWVFSVLCGHMIAALSMLGSCVLFVILQGILSWNDQRNGRELALRWKLAILVAPVTVIGILSLTAVAFEELGANNDLPMTEILYVLPSKFSFSYLITSICEWTLILAMWFTLATFCTDMSKSNFRIEIRHKTTKEIRTKKPLNEHFG